MGVENWSAKYDGKIMDSECIVAGSGVEFHFHLTVDVINNEEVVGFYIHYKSRPIPKYTFAIGNSKGRVVRQQTAHTIPKETKRCGHQKVIGNAQLRNAVARAGDDVCVIWFRFDTDHIASNGNLGEFMWSLPNFQNIRIGPFSSNSFSRIHADDRCTVKFEVDPRNRANVIPHISQRQHRHIPCIMKFHTPSQRVLHTTGEVVPGKWESIPYSTLTDLDPDRTLLVLVTFLQAQIRKEEKVPVTNITDVLPPPGMRHDADGDFDNLDDNMEPGAFTDDMSDDGHHAQTVTATDGQPLLQQQQARPSAPAEEYVSACPLEDSH
eukprot:TRINITY_DN30651_c0_g1_i2.p2 TRINITY_DN30651_c0_g1~~TRINITY_DN30651_c0_g1_i2.p2  ORF type:complete len:323 (+),score=121.98 TRINITY_DN30651_c0_g1_i2:220-1188(+)